MRFRRSTRRRFLMGAGGLGVTGLIGCSAPASTRPSFPTFDVPPPTYRQWVPAQSELVDNLPVVFNIERYRSKRDDIAADSYEYATSLATLGDYVGVDLEDMETVLIWIGFGSLITGDVDRERVRSVLENDRYEQYDAQGDVSLYRSTESDGETGRVAVGDRAVLKQYESGDSQAEWARILFETRAGNRERLYERSTPYRRFTKAVGFPCVVGPWSGRGEWFPSGLLKSIFDGSIATGMALYYDDGYTRWRDWVLTNTERDLSRSDLRAAVEAELSSRSGDEASDETVRVRIDDRVVEVVRSTPIEDPGGGADPPQVTVKARESDGQLIIEHLSGDPLALERLRIKDSEIGGFERGELGSGTFEPGETLSVDLPADASREIDVLYKWGEDQTDQLAETSDSQ